MADITGQNLNSGTEQVKVKHATQNGGQTEAEGLETAEVAHHPTNDGKGDNLYTKVRAIVEPVGGIELELPMRSSVRPVPFLGWQYEEEDFDNS